MTKKIEFADVSEMFAVLGERDEFLQILTNEFSCRITARGNFIEFSGEDSEVERAVRVVEELQKIHRRGSLIEISDIISAAGTVKKNSGKAPEKIFGETVIVTARGVHIHAKSPGQQKYLDTIRNNVITFGVGPAGTGKTYLAVAMAAYCLRVKKVKKIILTRPAVEAGERLGFLPGDVRDKVDPYLRPLYDALQDILGFDMYKNFFDRGVIEIAPLAYMRGRTLSDAFIILDEAQNTTGRQMKMFLTRLGFGSSMVVTGDLGQIDLPGGVKSGLAEAVEILKSVKGIGISRLDSGDVVRHNVVSRIIEAYAAHEGKNA